MSKEFKEWLKVSEIAVLLGYSRQAIYSKLDSIINTVDSETLQSLQKKEKSINYYNYKIVDMLRELQVNQINNIDEKLSQKSEETNNTLQANQINNNDETAADEVRHNVEDNSNNDECLETIKDEYINYLKAENERLWDELNKLTKLVENSQVLQLKQQPQDLKLLEEHFQDIDNKLIDLRQEMQQDKENEENKSIFKRFFKKKTL